MDTLQRLWRNGAVRGGTAVLAVLALLALLAPWLGTLDPSAMDASFVSAPAGTAGQVTLPDGRQLAHTFWMGSDSFGRDVWSRVLYGTRISLTVGRVAPSTATSVMASSTAGMAMRPSMTRMRTASTVRK